MEIQLRIHRIPSNRGLKRSTTVVQGAVDLENLYTGALGAAIGGCTVNGRKGKGSVVGP